jgi:hypothetical protein
MTFKKIHYHFVNLALLCLALLFFYSKSLVNLPTLRMDALEGSTTSLLFVGLFTILVRSLAKLYLVAINGSNTWGVFGFTLLLLAYISFAFVMTIRPLMSDRDSTCSGTVRFSKPVTDYPGHFESEFDLSAGCPVTGLFVPITYAAYTSVKPGDPVIIRYGKSSWSYEFPKNTIETFFGVFL